MRYTNIGSLGERVGLTGIMMVQLLHYFIIHVDISPLLLRIMMEVLVIVDGRSSCVLCGCCVGIFTCVASIALAMGCGAPCSDLCSRARSSRSSSRPARLLTTNTSRSSCRGAA